ncbi:LysM peptidoglycan-binding domain-containing protein [Sinomicrobium sp.]
MGVITKVALKNFTRVARGDISQYADVINQAASTVINETADEGVCFGTPEEAPPGDVFINNAFFAKKKEESGTIKYTVVSGDTLSGIASAHDTTVEAIKAKNNIENANAIKVGQELEVPSGEEEGTVSFEAITSANVGDEVYVVVEHFGKVNSVQVALKEKESLLTDGEALPVLQDDKEVSTITLCEPEEESLKGRYYCAEIKLRPEKDETLDSWREKLGEKELLGYTDTLNQRTVSREAVGAVSPVGMEPIYGDTVKSLLSIEVEAQAEEGEVVYCGRDRSNVFLNEEGEWFEVGGVIEGWSIEVHLYDNRSDMGYGILVLLNGNEEEYWRTVVRAQGYSSKIGGSRTQKMGDTPTGTYKFEQWRTDGSSTIYGENARLDMTYESGEAKAAGREEIQIHGGRQEGEDNPYLWNTGGCLRVFDDAIEILKEKIEELNSGNVKDYFIYIKNDLKYDSTSEKYYIPLDFEKLKENEDDQEILRKGIVNQKYYRNESNYYTDMLAD